MTTEREPGFEFRGYLNPLAFLHVDLPWAPHVPPVSTQDILEFVCTPGVDSDIASLVGRYKEISQENRRLHAMPAEPRMLSKLAWPLRHAKSGYMVGNYLGTIALCGLVAEMLSVLLFEISTIAINRSEKMTKKEQQLMFGREFEKLDHTRRIDILRVLGIISEEQRSKFDHVRTRRRSYLHLYSHDDGQIQLDAKSVYLATVDLVVDIIGQDIRDGKIYLRPELVEYLRDQGLTRDSSESASPDETA